MVGPTRWLVEAKAITTHFQPIFSIPQRSLVGMEALARGVAGPGYLIPPMQLFKMAAAERLSREVEELCRWSAARLFASVISCGPGSTGVATPQAAGYGLP